ncbi:MAG: AEC family transporter, partial [Mogibacterium sp.]|nr:AEC family transporter [Mogibacterium sp.]
LIWIICKIVTIKRDKDYAAVELISLMYSNCGFIGIPMAQGIFGSDGVLYMTAYVATANLLLWSHGVIVMSGKADLKSVIKVFRSPVIISIILGLIFFALQIELPAIVREPMEMIAAVNTPMAMMVAGVCIAQSDIKEAFCKIRLYWLSFVKLLLIPAVHIAILWFLPIPTLCKTVIVLASACPAGVTGNLFALRYGKDAIYASEIFAITTVLSALTVPLTMLFF